MLLMSMTFFGNKSYFKILFDFFLMNLSKFELEFNSFNASSKSLLKVTSSINAIQSFLKKCFCTVLNK